MDKLTAIKIKYDDGTYSDEIPVSVLSENVEWDSTHTLVDVLGSIDVDVTGTIQDQISQLFNEKVSATQLQNYVASQLSEDVSSWLNTNVNPVGSAVVVDSSLTISGAAADAKVVGDLKSAINYINDGLELINYINDGLESFPSTSETIAIDDFVQGLRHGRPNAEVKTDSDYITTDSIINFIAGDVLHCPDRDTYGYFLVDATGTFYETWLEEETSFNSSVSLYLEVRKTGITPSHAPTITITRRTSAHKIAEDFNELSNKVDNLFPIFEVCQKQINYINDGLESFPSTSETIAIDDFVQGLRHGRPNAEVKTDSDYITTSTIINFYAGDVLYCSNVNPYYYFLVDATGAYYETWLNETTTFNSAVSLYLEVKKTGITPSQAPAITITRKTSAHKIAEDFNELSNKVNNLTPVFEVCQKQGDPTVKRGYRINDNGAETSTADYLCCTTAMECSVGDVFLILQCYSVGRYNSAGTFIGNITVANLPLYSGNERWNVWISDTNGSVRFSLYWSTTPVECAVTRLNLTEYPYTCVSLGDSIFGNNQKPNDLPTYMQNVDGLMTANCGFGGTEAATHFNPIYTPLSFWKIADAINSGDWSDIDVDWNAINNDHVFMANVYILCHLVDWSKVRTLTVAYGTNDWNAGVSIDNESNSKDVTTYKGALRYGIEKIQSAYPQINIIMLSPLFRYWSNSQDYSTVDDDSDNRVNDGRKLYEYVTAMKEVAEEYHLPFYDNYNTAGINKITAPSILRDGTHLNYKYGVSMVGKHIGAEVALSNRNSNGGY